MNNISLHPHLDVNLALNKPTAQSSVYQPEVYGYDPYGACNGKKTGRFGFHTYQEHQPWWQIDLQATYQLTQIKIYNRINVEERASTLDILLSQDALNWELYYSNDPENLFGGIDGKPLIVDVPYKVARFLRLQLRDIESLHLDEVEIYGALVKPNSSQWKCSQNEATLSANFYRELRENLELEQRFAEQNGISLSSMRSQFFNPMFKSLKRTDTLKLSRFVKFDQLDKNNIIGDITALSIEKPGRFGNSIIQLSHAYQIAKEIGVYKIYLPNFWYIKSGETNTKSGIKIININKPNFSSEKIVLEGMFFDYQTLAPLSPKKLSKPNGYLNMIDLIEAFNLKNSERLGEQDLVIHIRSGDIFKNPHSNYGQPPLSFYKKIVELQSWHSITLVFEDKSNPIIQPLIDFCQHRCSLVQEISGDLRSDIEYLLKARILVVSRGSFSPAIATIAKNLETVYYFKGVFGVFSLENPNVSCIRVIDKQGVYKSEILSSNWQNTESQRKLMLEYPANALDFDSQINYQITPKQIKMDSNTLNLLNVNLALNKPTAQSSIYQPERYGYDPHGACNGKKDGGFGFHTLKENQPWWQIDLQGTYQLSEIKIYNRIASQERASTLNILLSHDALNWELCYSNDKHHLFGGIDGNPLLVNTHQKLARYLRLQLRENEYLHLDEVEIYGIPFQADGSELKSHQDEATLSSNFYHQANLPVSPHVMQNLIMNMLSKLRLHDTDLGKIRVGNYGDGGYVIPDDLVDLKGVVSIGIGREVSFDKHLADMGIKVFQYDHTIEAPPIVHENFLFNKVGWGAEDGSGFITLSKIIETNGLDDGDLLLKFDVENAEWDALSNVQPDLLKRFRMITCELHNFDQLENISVFNKVNRVMNLLTANHTVVHIHPNNCCGIALVAGIVLPKLIEFSFLRNDRASFYPSHGSIPSSLDYPNVKSQPEILLTPFHINVKNTNLALNKPTDQSSIHGSEIYGYDPYGACNGKKTGGFGFHTKKENQPWWQIDLKSMCKISEIRIYNRIICAERASTLNILLSNDGLNWELYYANDENILFGGIDGKPLIVDVYEKVARFIRLQLRVNDYLHLDEVEIYGIDLTANGSGYNLKYEQDEVSLSTNLDPNISQLLTLKSLGSKYGTDKVNHGFCDVYDSIFSSTRHRFQKVLEIGVFFGSSLLMWRDWMPSAIIHGADHFTGLQGNSSSFENPKKFWNEVEQGQHSRIQLHQLDQSSREDLLKFSKENLHGSFDIIIDDASHLMLDQQQTLSILLPLVKPGGFFVIEDLHSSLAPGYDVLPDGSNSTLQMINNALDGNGWHSQYMTPEEINFLNENIDISQSKIYYCGTQSKSITAILRRRMLPFSIAEIFLDKDMHQ